MAKRFNFRAEPVLKLRRQREREAMRRLAAARALAGEIQGRIAELSQRIARQDALVRRGVLTGTVDVPYMSLYRRHVMALHKGVIEQTNLLRAAVIEVARAGGEVREAMQQRKILSTLKDKLKARFDRDERRREQRETDEVGALAYAGRRRVPIGA